MQSLKAAAQLLESRLWCVAQLITQWKKEVEKVLCVFIPQTLSNSVDTVKSERIKVLINNC